MRILKGKDYYDGALAYGTDKETVFVRDNLVFEKEDDFKKRYGQVPLPAFRGFSIKPNRKLNWRERYGRDSEFTLRRDGIHYSCRYSSVTVFVAGVRYHGLAVEEVQESGFNRHFPPIRHVFWNEETLRTYVEALDHRIDVDSLLRFGDRDKDRSLTTFFNPQTSDRDFDFLVNNRISILTYGWQKDRWLQKVWTVNGDNLQDLQFAKRMDPYQIFQELSMYVGGILPKDGPPMVEITDDKMKAHKAGFDTKWSFRRTNEHKPNS